jgi:DNA-binding FadR family transcriptional regulator
MAIVFLSNRFETLQVVVGKKFCSGSNEYLEATGLVKATREGNTIRDRNSRASSPLTFDEEKITIYELFEARRFLDLELSAMAADRATAD